MAYHKFTSGEPLDEGAVASNQYFMEEKYVLDEESFQRALALGGLYKRSDKPLHAQWWEVHDKENHFITQINGEAVLVKIPENEREEGKDPVKLTPVAIENDCTLHKITIDESSLTGPATTTYTFSVAAHGQGGAISKPSTTAVIVEPTGAGDIIDGAITKTKLMPGCVTTDAIAAGAITADLLACTNLLAKGAYVGALSSLGMVIKDAMFVCTRDRLDAQGDLTSDYNFFNKDGLNYDFHDLDGNAHRYPATNGEVFFGTNPYCEETKERLPAGETLESMGADYKDASGQWVRDRDEYFHYIPSVFEEDKTTHKTVCKKQGMFIFKIANFVITAISSVIKGVFQVEGKHNNGRVLLTANPENDEREGVAPHTVSINGELNAKSLSKETLIAMADYFMPVGFVYTQYPNTPDPNDAYVAIGLVWDEITPNYAGAFFRAEGGNAKAFNGGRQGEGLPNITGSFNTMFDQEYTSFFSKGAFTHDKSRLGGTKSRSDPEVFDVYFNAHNSNAIYGASAHVTPENFSIRLWRRAKVVIIAASDASIAWTGYVPFMDEITSGDDIVPFMQLSVTDSSVTPPVITKSNSAEMTYVSGFVADSVNQNVVFHVSNTGIRSKLLPTSGIDVTTSLALRPYRPMLSSSDVRLLWTGMSAPRVNEVTDGDVLTSLLTACTTDGTIIQGVNIAYADGFTSNITTAQDVTFRLTLPNSDRFRMPSEGLSVVFSVQLRPAVVEITASNTTIEWAGDVPHIGDAADGEALKALVKAVCDNRDVDGAVIEYVSGYDATSTAEQTVTWRITGTNDDWDVDEDGVEVRQVFTLEAYGA